MNLYDLVKDILVKCEPARNSDKRLIWEVLDRKGFISRVYNEGVLTPCITLRSWKNCPTLESITRARRKVQQHHPELCASESVKKKREELTTEMVYKIFKEE